MFEETTTARRFSYGLDEISELTGLSTAFLRKLARAGTLKTKKFGARRLVLEADLQEFLKGENDEQK
jgi:excisionase family DNA binding protein